MTLYALSDEKMTYVSQRQVRTNDEIYLITAGPPNSPPKNYQKKKLVRIELLRILTILLRPRMMKQMVEVIKNSITEKARLPGGVLKSSCLLAW